MGSHARLLETAIGHEDGFVEDNLDERQLLSFLQSKIRKTVTSSNNSSKIYCLVESNNCKQTIDLDSYDAVDWLRAIYHRATSKIVAVSMCHRVLSLLKSEAKIAQTPSEIIYQRTAFVNDTLYYDLCNDSWELVRITHNSTDIVKHGEDTPLFQRDPNQTEQVMPNFDYDASSIDQMCELLRMNGLLFKVHLISFFVGSITTPIMAIMGQHGSTKSTQGGLIKRIVDPAGNTTKDNLFYLPNDIDALNIHFSNNLVTSFDNVSSITSEQSDTLCRAVTGAGYTKRKLHTDSQEVLLKFKRKVILNGIAFDIERDDLVGRTIIYRTNVVQKNQRKTASDIENEFAQILPDFLGHVFKTLQKTLAMHNSVRGSITDLSSMADFEIMGECISRALGNSPGAFQAEYKKSMKNLHGLSNKANSVMKFFSNMFKSTLPYTSRYVHAIQCLFSAYTGHEA